MATNLCGIIGGNVGPIQCEKKPGIPKKIFPGAKTFVSADYADSATFKAALLAACKLAMGSSTKLFPSPEVQGVEDKTEANKEGTLAFGFKEVLLEGLPAWEFKFLMGTTEYQAWRKFNGATIPVFITDNQNLFWGKRSGATNTDLVGFDAYLWFTGNKFGNASENVVVTGTISLRSATDFHDYASYIPFNFNINDAKGLMDVVLSEPVSHTSNVYKIKAEILTAQLGNKINLHDDYAAVLNDDALWVAHTGANYGTALTITSVAADATNKGFTVTFDSTAFTALSSGAKIKFNLAAPSVLDAANVVGVEGTAIILTK